MSEQDATGWVRVVEHVGLPTALLLITLAAAWWVFRRHVLPWIGQLVKSHVDFVAAVRDESRACREEHKAILARLEKLGGGP